MKEDIRGGIFESVLEYVRNNHEEDIDKAYDYFWEEEYPEDFLSGTTLDLSFINFEDWLVCDYVNEGNETLIDVFIKNTDPSEDTNNSLQAMRKSVISLYEVASAENGKRLIDLMQKVEISTHDSALTGLQKGDVFGARFIEIEDEYVMGRAVYPFNQSVKDMVLGHLEKQFNRYIKRKNMEGTVLQFLKEEAYLINQIWLSSLIIKRKQ